MLSFLVRVCFRINSALWLIAVISVCSEVLTESFFFVVWFLMQASEDLLREHYIDLKDRPFYDGLVQYMHSGPVVAMVSS